MLFAKPKRSPFSAFPGTPGIGDGVAQPEMAAPGLGMQAEQQPAKRGLFARGGVGRAIAGNVGDFMLQYSGMKPIYGPSVQARQEEAARLREASLKRSTDLEDYEAKKKIDQRYAATAPYRWRNNDGDLMELGADGQPRVAYNDPTDKIDWIQVKDPVSGAISIIARPRGGAGEAPDVLPPDFDFGGGGASNGTSGFREAFAEWN